MKKLIAFTLVMLFLLAVPVSAESYLVLDSASLMEEQDVQRLEQVYDSYSRKEEFTPVAVIVNDFGGLSAEDYAAQMYTVQSYPKDCAMFLLSVKEGQWYIFTSGSCARRFSDEDIYNISETLLPLIQEEQYFAAFLSFPERVLEYYDDNEPEVLTPIKVETEEVKTERTYGKLLLTCCGWGLLLGTVVAVVMAVQMRSVSTKHTAADYIVPGSANLVSSRDVYLYSRTSRSPKPKPKSSSGPGRPSGGRSHGGAGGRI